MSLAGVQQQPKAHCDVLVQGAGIAGLTLAIALQQRGYQVKLVERAAGLAEVGAGIWMAANPMQVFARLGFAEKIVQVGWTVKLLRLQDWKSGEIQTTNMSRIAKEYGFETIALHRAVLQRLLFEQLEADPVRFGCEVKSVTQNGDQVFASLSDGSSCTAAIIVGADGFNSQIRRMAELGGVKRYSGSSSYRAIARGGHILSAEAEHEAYEIWARGCRLGFSKINAGDYYWYMTFDAPAGEASSASEIRTHAETLFRNYFPQWIGLVQNTPTQDILRTDISDLKPLTKWSSGRIGLIGDAAHATTPNLGQGGAMAVEDALALADAFKELGLNQAAWRRFEQRRRKKVDWTVSTSWSIGKICHLGNPLFRSLRNIALKKTPDSVTHKQVQRIYSLQSTVD
ncbi:MAG TPA: FAD-dependent monooxygenase [Bryobacteraceae bacterium]|jgi:2-polyprenyl-6-methoxyphenol hydroxylase-like FAD-dependent oxidoreductase